MRIIRIAMNIKSLFHSFIAGAVGTLFVLGGTITLLAFNKGRVSEYLQTVIQQPQSADMQKSASPLGELVGTITDVIKGDTVRLAEKMTVTDVVKKANPAVVSIIITQEVPKYEIVQNPQPFNPFDPFSFLQEPIYRQNGTEKKNVGGGSGFIISPDGYIITNRHVISHDNAEYMVQLANGRKYPAKIVARDAVLDVGVLKITGNGFAHLALGDSDTLELGQQVVAIGNALAEFQNSVSQGIISGLGRSITASNGQGGLESLDKVIQTDAAINPGNSGGPLLNMYGEVIGVNVAVAQGSQNIGFALPINTVRPIVESILKTGTIVRPYVGIRYAEVTPELQRLANLPADYGIIIRPGQNPDELAVIPGSPADKAGLKENDIILSFDGVKISSGSSFALLVREKKVGQKVSLKVLSDGAEKGLTLTLEAAPQ